QQEGDRVRAGARAAGPPGRDEGGERPPPRERRCCEALRERPAASGRDRVPRAREQARRRGLVRRARADAHLSRGPRRRARRASRRRRGIRPQERSRERDRAPRDRGRVRALRPRSAPPFRSGAREPGRSHQRVPNEAALEAKHRSALAAAVQARTRPEASSTVVLKNAETITHAERSDLTNAAELLARAGLNGTPKPKVEAVAAPRHGVPFTPR